MPPLPRRRTVCGSELAAEIPWIDHADPGSDLGHRQIGIGEQLSGPRHPALDDPFADGAAGASADQRREMARGQTDRVGDVPQ